MAGKTLIATYSYSGTTKRVADQLVAALNADQYQIEVPTGTFTADMYETDAIAKKQIADNNYPDLVNALPDLSQYGLVLVGSPVWSGRPASPIHTFLTQIQDFTGKVATFYTDAGSAGDYEKVFSDWAGKLNVVGAHEGTNGLTKWAQNL